jgi:hypothetical protein
VSRQIASISDSYGTLKILNELYDTHYEIELIQLMLNLFNLELKNDDPMALAFEIIAIMHDIESTRVKIDFPLMAFINSLYPTYSYYLESLQVSNQMKSMTFQKPVRKLADHEKAFGKKPTPSTREIVYLAKKDNSKIHDSSIGERSRRGSGHGRKSFIGRG